MTLIPPQNRPLPNAETKQETTLETEILDELRTIGKKVDSLVVLRVALMGDESRETPHGRLPRVESKTDDHDARISKLEVTHIRWKAYLAAAVTISSLVGSIVGGMMALIAQYILNHLGGH